MKTLYLECNMGAAGDMLLAALLELHPEPEQFLERFRKVGIPGLEAERVSVTKCGVQGTGLRIRIYGQEEESHDADRHSHSHSHSHAHSEGEPHNHSHAHSEGKTHNHSHAHGEGETHSHSHAHGEGETHTHSHHEGETHSHSHFHTQGSLQEIRKLAEQLQVSEKVRQNILAVYGLIAEAESQVHAVPIEQIHFHEVGTLDAVADVTGVCMLMEELSPEFVTASAVHVGSGQVRCAHGILPVPAPATALLLKGIPIYSAEIRGELCTPTGAALLKHFVRNFGAMPAMQVSKIGYGMGKKEFAAANCVRAFLGNGTDVAEADTVLELKCNLDDMTAEAIAFACEMLMEQGALDVYTIPIGMKKGRPGTLLSCMCRPKDKQAMTRAIFQYTTTIGIRETLCRRCVLQREEWEMETPYGMVRIKEVSGYGVQRQKPEYEDMAKISRERGLSLDTVRKQFE